MSSEATNPHGRIASRIHQIVPTRPKYPGTGSCFAHCFDLFISQRVEKERSCFAVHTCTGINLHFARIVLISHHPSLLYPHTYHAWSSSYTSKKFPAACLVVCPSDDSSPSWLRLMKIVEITINENRNNLLREKNSSRLENSTELAPGASRRTAPLCVNMPILINKELNGTYPFLSINGSITHGEEPQR